jgi:hypothetical protein
MVNAPTHEQARPAGQDTAPADRPDVASRIERARRQLAPAKDERAPSDSRWQNWYSR